MVLIFIQLGEFTISIYKSGCVAREFHSLESLSLLLPTRYLKKMPEAYFKEHNSALRLLLQRWNLCCGSYVSKCVDPYQLTEVNLFIFSLSIFIGLLIAYLFFSNFNSLIFASAHLHITQKVLSAMHHAVIP